MTGCHVKTSCGCNCCSPHAELAQRKCWEPATLQTLLRAGGAQRGEHCCERVQSLVHLGSGVVQMRREAYKAVPVGGADARLAQCGHWAARVAARQHPGCDDGAPLGPPC